MIKYLHFYIENIFFALFLKIFLIFIVRLHREMKDHSSPHEPSIAIPGEGHDVFHIFCSVFLRSPLRPLRNSMQRSLPLDFIWSK